jgi:hypothetical protein
VVFMPYFLVFSRIRINHELLCGLPPWTDAHAHDSRGRTYETIYGLSNPPPRGHFTSHISAINFCLEKGMVGFLPLLCTALSHSLRLIGLFGLPLRSVHLLQSLLHIFPFLLCRWRGCDSIPCRHSTSCHVTFPLPSSSKPPTVSVCSFAGDPRAQQT